MVYTYTIMSKKECDICNTKVINMYVHKKSKKHLFNLNHKNKIQELYSINKNVKYNDAKMEIKEHAEQIIKLLKTLQ